MCTPRAKPMCAPRAEPMCAPRAEPCTPSEAEGWDCYYDAAPMGLVHPERSRVHPERSRRVHPERSRGVGLLLWCRPNGAIVPRAEPCTPRAKPRGGTVTMVPPQWGYCTPSGAEGWDCTPDSRLGFARRTVY
jgi:hypothetical protein